MGTRAVAVPSPRKRHVQSAIYQMVQNGRVEHEAATVHECNVWAAHNRFTGVLVEINLDGDAFVVRTYKKGE